jgi:TonB family protein
VLANGTVGEVHVISAPAPRTAGLDAAAIEAVKQWRFTPGLVNGKPAPVIVQVEMTFTLR